MPYAKPNKEEKVDFTKQTKPLNFKLDFLMISCKILTSIKLKRDYITYYKLVYKYIFSLT